MTPCSICGAEHEAAQDPGSLVPCVRALAARVAALESQRYPVPASVTTVPVVVPLGGSASGSGGLK